MTLILIVKKEDEILRVKEKIKISLIKIHYLSDNKFNNCM